MDSFRGNSDQRHQNYSHLNYLHNFQRPTSENVAATQYQQQQYNWNLANHNAHSSNRTPSIANPNQTYQLMNFIQQHPMTYSTAINYTAQTSRETVIHANLTSNSRLMSHNGYQPVPIYHNPYDLQPTLNMPQYYQPHIYHFPYVPAHAPNQLPMASPYPEANVINLQTNISESTTEHYAMSSNPAIYNDYSKNVAPQSNGTVIASNILDENIEVKKILPIEDRFYPREDSPDSPERLVIDLSANTSTSSSNPASPKSAQINELNGCSLPINTFENHPNHDSNTKLLLSNQIEKKSIPLRYCDDTMIFKNKNIQSDVPINLNFEQQSKINTTYLKRSRPNANGDTKPKKNQNKRIKTAKTIPTPSVHKLIVTAETHTKKDNNLLTSSNGFNYFIKLNAESAINEFKQYRYDNKTIHDRLWQWWNSLQSHIKEFYENEAIRMNSLAQNGQTENTIERLISDIKNKNQTVDTINNDNMKSRQRRMQ